MLLDEIPPGMPSGTPISHSILIRPHLHDSYFRNAVAAVDAVHGDGILPKIEAGIMLMEKHEGAFDGIAGIESSFVIAVDPRVEAVELTALHEIGHVIDFCALGRGRRYQSAKSQEMQRWRSQVQKSKSYKTLANNRGYLSAKIELPDTRTVEISLNQEFVEYSLEWRELFARSYAQYIAMQSRNKTLQEQLDQARNQPIHQIYAMQWHDADFHDIAQALDQVLRQREWIV